MGTRPKGPQVLDSGGSWLDLGCCGVECCKAQWQKLSSAATGEETEVANADKAFGKQMQEKAAQELIER